MLSFYITGHYSKINLEQFRVKPKLLKLPQPTKITGG
jgi:hypothetical protein